MAMFCTQCGSERVATDAFCRQCGFQQARPTVQFAPPAAEGATESVGEGTTDLPVPLPPPVSLPASRVAPPEANTDEADTTNPPTIEPLPLVDETRMADLSDRCVYCLDRVDLLPHECPSCHRAYHLDCWHEFGGCIERSCTEWRLRRLAAGA